MSEMLSMSTSKKPISRTNDLSGGRSKSLSGSVVALGSFAKIVSPFVNHLPLAGSGQGLLA